ncbi:MAG: hypothetical protein AB1646_09520 [Thermodesulfobacteriota bacterium]
MIRSIAAALIALICLMPQGDASAGSFPPYVRLNGGARVWFSRIEGDLIQPNNTKLGLTENLAINPERVAWDYFGSLRLDNVHVLRVNAEIGTAYDQSRNDSYFKTWNAQVTYDLDFYMTPQFLLGSQTNIGVVGLETLVNNVKVGDATFNYHEKISKVVPSLGFHGIFYPILSGISVRPNFSGRLNWWNYESLELYDWEVAGAFDVPLNRKLTWSMGGGYRFSRLGMKRNNDRVEFNRRGFFLETSLLF